MMIIPGILEQTYEELHKQVQALKGHTDWLQVDVADGQFVDNMTLALDEIPTDEFAGFSVEAHLMVAEPETLISECKRLGIKRMIVHFEAVRDDIDVLVEHIKAEGMQVSIALNPGTNVAQLETVAEYVDAVLLMTIQPGAQGREFIPEVLSKVQELRMLKQNMLIGIDGGVKADLLPQLLKYNLDYVTVGSAISQADDPVKALDEMRELVV